MRGKIIRQLLEAGYALGITYIAGKWASHYAYLERGYKAMGSEYLILPFVCWGAYKVIHYILEGKNERSKKKRSGRAARMQHYR